MLESALSTAHMIVTPRYSMKHFFVTIFATMIGLVLGIVLLFSLLAALGAALAPKDNLPGAMVLELDLTQELVDQSTSSEIFDIGGSSIVDITRKLDQAKADDRVSALFVRANPYGMPIAQAEEIRLALIDFQDSGKTVIAHAQGFEGPSLSNYLAISAIDNIWLQDTATFSAAGFRSETGFFGGVFEKFDAEPQFEQFKEYKTAANIYTQTGFTDAHRESTKQMLDGLFQTAVNYIALDRELELTAVTTLLENAPHSAETALEAGLVDILGHYATARKAAKEAAGIDAKFISISAYDLNPEAGAPLIALVGGQGAIMPGKSSVPSPFSPASTMGSDTLSEALTDAAENRRVKAIILRIDSPGGSAIASDQIWDAVIRAKETGKPVIISMGQYAASGGYYVAAPADKIVALDTTLTGSIGVLGGKVVIDKTAQKLGYNVEALSVGGDYTKVFSPFETWDQKTRAAFRQTMEDIYIDFTSRVAEGRGMSMAQVEEVARGRVWTGAQAKEAGLVDELGGLTRAIEIAKEASGIDANSAVNIRHYPRAKTLSEEISELLGGTVKAGQGIGQITAQINALLSDPAIGAAITAKMQADMIRTDKSLLAPLPVID